MGYYSFYKIFKDIIKTLFGYKFFKILLISIIIFSLFFIFAENFFIFGAYVSPTFDYPDFSSIIDNYNYFVLSYFNAGSYQYYYLDVCNSSSDIYFRNDGIYMTTSNISSYRCLSTNRQWVYMGNNNSGLSTYSIMSNFETTGQGIIYTNFDILYQNGNIAIEKNFNTTKPPEVSTTLQDLQNLNFEVVSIDAWDYSNEDLYFLVYDRNYEDTESLTNLYPVNEILLNFDSNYYMQDITADPETNKIYWIPKGDLGLEWKIGGSYGFRFAIRESIESDFADWTYNYITEEFQFTVNNTVSNDVIASFNNSTQETKKDNQFNDINNNLTQQKEQDQQFYNNILSNNYNENLAGDTLTGSTSSTDSIDNSAYIGLFSTLFRKIFRCFRWRFFNSRGNQLSCSKH